MVDKSVNLEGLLEKESGVFKKKSSVWVVLDSLGLSFYRPEKRSSCIGSVKVTDILTVRKTGHVRGNQFEVQTDTNSYLFNATNAELADTWVNGIQVAMTNNSLNGSETNPGHLCNSTSGQEEANAKESNSDTSSIPASTNIFGVKLKRSIKRDAPSASRQSGESTHNTQRIQPQAHTNRTGDIRRTQPVSNASPLKNRINVQPENKQPGMRQPETKKPETKQPETTQLETTKQESTQPDPIKPESKQPETIEPESAQLENTKLRTTQLKTTKLETTQQETRQPEAKQQETKQPETTQLETTQQESMQPETIKPESKQTETTLPETKQPKTTQLETKQPETTQLKTTPPKIIQPKTTQPETTQQETTQPETTGNQKSERGAPPQPPQRKESLPVVESTKNVSSGVVKQKPAQTSRAPPSFKPPPPPNPTPTADRSTSMAIKGEDNMASGSNVVTDENDNNVFKDVSTTNDEFSGSSTKEENVLPSNGSPEALSKTPTVDSSNTQTEETVQVRKPRGTGLDKDIREKNDHSDVDISGVEMRRSRNSRSNRNNSINDSWSQSAISVVDSKTNITAMNASKAIEEPSKETTEELSNLEDIIGSLLSKGTDAIPLENLSTTDVTIDLSAFVRLKAFLEDMEGLPFDVSSHRITNEDSVERLRSILCD